MSSSSSSSSSSSVSSSSIREENNENLPGMDVGFQELEERIFTERTTTCTTTQPPVPSIIDIVGCDITIEDIQTAKKELINQKFDLKMDVNKWQKSVGVPKELKGFSVTPLIHFCRTGNLLMIKLLFLIGADCTKLCKANYYFPMLAAAEEDHLDICKWLFEHGGDAKYQINKENSYGFTPLSESYEAWHRGEDNEGKTCQWLLRNGGGQHLSYRAMHDFVGTCGLNSNLLVLWMREKIQLYDTFKLFLCGATNLRTSSLSSLSSSSEPDDGGTRKRKHKHKRERRRHLERSLQILDGHPGIMEVIGNYVGVIRGKEFRRFQEFNELVIEYIAYELA